MSGSLGQSGAHIGANVDFAIFDAVTGSRTHERYETVYVVPNRKASP